jgi:hypothetical protein
MKLAAQTEHSDTPARKWHPRCENSPLLASRARTRSRICFSALEKFSSRLVAGGMGLSIRPQKSWTTPFAIKLLAPDRVQDRSSPPFSEGSPGVAGSVLQNNRHDHDFGQAGDFYFLLDGILSRMASI